MGKQGKELKVYSTTEFEGEIRLALNRNESACSIEPLARVLSKSDPATVSRYPSYAALQGSLADWLAPHGIVGDRIVVTNGGDEGIDRIVRNAIADSKKVVATHSPSFEMFDIYTHNAGGSIRSTPWMNGPFPTADFIGSLDESVALAVVVSPNNPTGRVVPLDDILAIAKKCDSLGIDLLVDCAYVEFADEDPTQKLGELSNVIMVRTFSKAWGLAGMRVGYLIAPDTQSADRLRSAAGPFPVSGMSLRLANEAMASHVSAMEANVARIVQFRTNVTRMISQCGGEPIESQGNFVLARFENVGAAWTGLAEQGIGVRKFTTSELNQHLRITIPATESDMITLARGFSQAFDVSFDFAKFTASENSIAESASADSDDVAHGSRVATLNRKTKETDIQIELDLDGDGTSEISTGIGFLDHMLTALSFHSRMNLKLICEGDLHIDDHHTAEDCALALGTAIGDALGERRGIKRFGYAYAPLDEALARTVLDLSGRPWPEVHLALEREMVGTIATENLTHFFQSLAMTLKCSLHVDVLRGDNDHHRAEAAFKSLALALKMAIRPSGNDVPSTKGVI